MEQVKFGWAEVDITPTEKIALRGEFFERVTNEVETPISYTALAVESEGEQAVFVSADLVGVNEDLIGDAVKELKTMGLNGLDPDKIIVSAIHTHNSYDFGRAKNRTDSFATLRNMMGPDCVYIPSEHDPDQMAPDVALKFLAGKLAEVIYQAWNSRKPGGYANGFGRAAIGMCRRVCYADDTAKMWGDADHAAFTQLEGGNDSGIEMLFIYDDAKNLTGVVANVACPAQVMEQRSVISGDYWGKVKILLREKYGKDLFVLGLCAPAGDQCPRDLIRWVEPETPIRDPNVIRENPKERRADPSMFDIKGTWTIGRRIVNEIEYALEEVTEIKTTAQFRHLSKRIYLPLRRVTETDKLIAEKKIDDFFKGKKVINYMDTAALHVYTGTLTRYELQKTVDTVEISIHHIRFDDVAFSTSPFELFLDYANQIRARSKAKQTFLIQLCGDLGYLPTETAERHGHYSAYISSGYVGHEGGDLLVRDTLTEINKMFD